jgi:hypothetical protein
VACFAFIGVAGLRAVETIGDGVRLEIHVLVIETETSPLVIVLIGIERDDVAGEMSAVLALRNILVARGETVEHSRFGLLRSESSGLQSFRCMPRITSEKPVGDRA